MIGLLLLFIALFINVALHELGHMIVAKLFKMEVPTYSIGMGPVLLKHKWGSTTYCICAIPLGGYCTIKGMMGEEIEGEGTYYTSKWYHILVAVAGAFFNILIMLVSLFLLCQSYLNAPPKVTVTDVTEQATTLGFKVDDEILSVDGSKNVMEALDTSKDKLDFKIKRGDEIISFTVDCTTLKDRVIGIHTQGMAFVEGTTTWKLMEIEVKEYLELIPTVFHNLKESIISIYTPGSDFSEENGITLVASASFIKNSYDKLGDSWYRILLNLNIGLGFSLAFFNLLPIPCLDGGRIVITLIDIITRRKISPKVFNAAIAGTYIILLGFMIVTMVIEAIRI